MRLAGPSTTQFEDDLHDALLGEDPEWEEEEEAQEDESDEEGE